MKWDRLKPSLSWMRSMSLRSKVTMITMLTCTFALIVSGVVQIAYTYGQARSMMLDDLETSAAGMGRNCQSGLLFADAVFVAEALEALDAQTHIQAAAVYDAEGVLCAVYPESQSVVPRSPLDVRRRFGADLLEVCVPIEHEVEGRVGSIYLRSDQSKIAQRMGQYYKGIALVLLMACLLSYVIASRLRGFLIAPIVDLARMTEKVRDEQDFSLRSTKTSNDEIGVLIDSYNEMLEGIEKRDRELEQHRGHLESQVEKRMRELRMVNEALRRAKDDAESAVRVKTDFLANVSHEIRTPLNGIIGMTGLLMDMGLLAEQRGMISTIRNCGEQLLTLINDVLDFSKIEAGKLELEEIDFDLRSVIEDVSDILAPKAEEKRLELLCMMHPKVPEFLRGDPSRLRQILLNLLTNAVKFTDRGQVMIEVACVQEDTGSALIKLAVHDTGIGVPPERMDRLFQSFTQVDSSTTRKYGGTGLGLTISDQIARVMQSQIQVESTVGKGSTFWLEARFKKQACAQRPPASPKELHGLKVLVLDDNRASRTILCQQLEAWGARPSAHAQAPEALEALRRAAATSEPYGLALLDFQMPGADGVALAATIHADEKLVSLPLVLLTSMAFIGKTRRLSEVGIAGHLTKPVKRGLLLDCLGTLLGQPDPTAEPGEQLPAAAEPSLFDTALRKRARILLVEDNVVNQRVAIAVLSRGGYRCEVANNGREAVEIFEGMPLDVVLMDCQMPEMDGFEATRAIRVLERERGEGNVPIVAMTANAMEGDRDRCIQAGMNDYITKPFNQASLYKVLETWLEVSMRRRGLITTESRAGAGAERQGQVDAFLGDAPALLGQLGDALGRGDAHRAVELAEELSKRARALGADEFAQRCDGLRQTCSRQDTEPALEALSRLEVSFSTVNAQLDGGGSGA